MIATKATSSSVTTLDAKIAALELKLTTAKLSTTGGSIPAGLIPAVNFVLRLNFQIAESFGPIADATTNTITIVEAGVYRVTSFANFTTVADNSNITFAIHLGPSGTTTAITTTQTKTNSSTSLAFSDTVTQSFVANDVISVAMTGGSTNIFNPTQINIDANALSVVRLS
mgnify:CR=1 FL=1